MPKAVLVAEPEPATRGFLERHLADDGFDVLGAAACGEALELAERARPDLVLLGDTSALEECRSWSREVPLIVIGGGGAGGGGRPPAFGQGGAAATGAAQRGSLQGGGEGKRRGGGGRDRRRRPRPPAGEGVRAPAQARLRPDPRLHQGGALARGVGLSGARAHTHARFARLPPAPEARRRGRRAIRAQRLGGGLQAAQRLTSTSSRATVSAAVPRSDLLGRSGPVVWAWAALAPALPAAVPAVLAFLTATAVSAANGGYFPTEWGWSAIALLLVAGTAVVVRTRLPLGRLEWTMLLALAAFTGWVALSIVWSTSSAQPVLEAERDVVYVAAVAALVAVALRRSVPWIAGAVLAATYSISAFSLATRLTPDAVGSYDSSGQYQLATPFGYWNALGLFVAIGLLLGVGFAANGRSVLLRAAAAAALVPLACTLYFTFSRGAWLAVAAGAIVALALDPARLRTVAILLALLPAPALAVFAASRSHALTHAGAPLAAAARDGHRVAVVLVVLSVLEALVALALCGPGRRLVENRRAGIAAAATLVVVVGVGAGAALVRAGGPAKLVGNAYDAFTSPERPNGSDLNRRLVNLSGSGRTDYWRVAWHDFVDHPLLGSGAGSYERFWIRDRPNAFYARDAHNLYLEVLAELGPVGLALLAIGLGTPLVAAVRLPRRPPPPPGAGASLAAPPPPG